jgi:hypothetical protein
MGYIGLLLNAPYKIDSMMRMRLMISFDILDCPIPGIYRVGYTNQEVV